MYTIIIIISFRLEYQYLYRYTYYIKCMVNTKIIIEFHNGPVPYAAQFFHSSVKLFILPLMMMSILPIVKYFKLI